MITTKLTPKVLDKSLNVVSPEGKLTLSLRNQHVQFIENLEFTNDTFSVIDLTNNEITELSNIPAFNNLETVLLGNNNVSSINQASIVELESLSLANNNISSFKEVQNLKSFPNLRNLLMLGNPIAADQHYRLFVIWLLPKLQALDCQKVKRKERQEAKRLLGDNFDSRLPTADALLHGSRDSVNVPKETRVLESTVKKLTEEERAQLVQQLEEATSMQEINRISNALKSGDIYSNNE